ncbi:MAG: polysaccharide deacetylase family protein, partial [Firmicutes bacterium]|nr:polysaccharide deacetylase family protein [Bacillota bacterium]
MSSGEGSALEDDKNFFKHGRQSLKLKEAAVSFDRLQAVTNTLDRGLVTITFDDGYESVYNEAKPRMDKYGFSVAAYIITDLAGAPVRMTLKQLKELQLPLI